MQVTHVGVRAGTQDTEAECVRVCAVSCTSLPGEKCCGAGWGLTSPQDQEISEKRSCSCGRGESQEGGPLSEGTFPGTGVAPEG